MTSWPQGFRCLIRGLLLLEVGVEPREGAGDDVALVFGIGEEVAFALVDYELRFDAEGLERMPEFVGLRGGDFAIAVADQNQRGRFYPFDESDGRAPRINFRLVIDGLAEER